MSRDAHALDKLVEKADRLLRGRAREAERDIARLVKLRPSIATEFHAMGVILTRLREARIARALGHRDLYELAATRARLGRRDVADLVAVAASLTEAESRELGWRLAAAFVALARAAGSRPYLLYERGLVVRGSVALPPHARRVRAVLEAAKTLRHRAGTSRGGRTTTAGERAAATALAAVLRAAGHTARVEAVATRPGRPATFRVLDLDEQALSRIMGAFCGSRRSRAR